MPPQKIPVGTDAEYKSANEANAVRDLDGRRYRCDAHWDTPSTDEVCVVCLLESVGTLTKEVASLEGERDAARREMSDARRRAMNVAKAYGCNATDHSAATGAAQVQDPVDLGTQVQYLFDQVKELEDQLNKVYHTVAKHVKAFDRVEGMCRAAQANREQTADALRRTLSDVGENVGV